MDDKDLKDFSNKVREVLDVSERETDRMFLKSSLIAFAFVLLIFIAPSFFPKDKVVVTQEVILKPYSDEEVLTSLGINALGVVVKEINSLAPLLEREGDKQWPVASLTKIMSSLIATENFGLGTYVPISTEAVLTEGVSGNFRSGESFTVEDLVKSMMVVSSNDGAFALYEYGEREEFTAKMNLKAESLGMSKTSFSDPTGLSYLNVSTPNDLQKLVQYVYSKQPFIFDISREKAVIIHDNTTGTSRALENINSFSGVDNFLGGKTGYTDEAGQNLLSLFSHNNRTFMIIVFGSEDRFNETQRLYDWLVSYL
ncbi:MAG: hypothetical protein COU06_02110 [Candidatus Harrisonbacteria bacterium CG10_big_fil_rev_8_21_14_0_10_38_8]|uniref:Peptidase S11 D-alanyl-D-alanine carboxypeptidase A N-terminal domain-containing protein n=1 Tax=Candidatus Harrisonbacteria bacterium CG10_big_fil_rev_8_21_14_0_10_38_8 TaxID=1974582 RepID=A0A2M6WJS0_9BACT|nr:MAG: hypothetical protein COU06_02110 [Candidatus Harrisonbacteria bacterium CG10_big_fil_rev_8_21_14_0_10_38_8]